MRNIILIAPPAAGKGTQSGMLIKKYKYEHISTGDLLRNIDQEQVNLKEEIDQIIKSGNLVPNDIVTKLLEKKLKTTKGPIVFDGYPRNIEQALDLERILSDLNIDLGIAIYLDIEKEEAIKRATGREMCPKCNKIYNINFEKFKPKEEGKCDVCLIDLIKRPDDTKESYAIRYEIYKQNISPLLNYYSEKGSLIKIKTSDYPKETFNKIEEVIL